MCVRVKNDCAVLLSTLRKAIHYQRVSILGERNHNQSLVRPRTLTVRVMEVTFSKCAVRKCSVSGHHSDGSMEGKLSKCKLGSMDHRWIQLPLTIHLATVIIYLSYSFIR